jgi:sulfate permease, SulP family
VSAQEQRRRARPEWVAAHRRPWLRGDVVGGLVAGTVVLPQAMAYATVAGLPPEVGLYTCMVPMTLYALLGGGRTASFSTTSTVATLTASTLLTAGVAEGAPDPFGAVCALTLLVGVVVLTDRVLRLGRLIYNVSDGRGPPRVITVGPHLCAADYCAR